MFALNLHQAYAEFTAKKFQVGETVDGYLAELSRLQSLIGSTDEAILAVSLCPGYPKMLQCI